MGNLDFYTDILPLKDKLFRLALRITMNRAEAEDVVQETMLRVWSRRDQWAEIVSVEAFCMTICRNMALDRQKSAGNKTLSIDDNTSLSVVDDSFAEYQDSMAIVRRIVNSLPEKQRTIIHLREIEGKTYREIADILCVSEEQVKVNLFRARQTIRQKFSEVQGYGL